jgi:predicted DNA-binding ribbon-helix-helix protein
MPKRCVVCTATIDGAQIKFSLEPLYAAALHEIALDRDESLAALVKAVRDDPNRKYNLSASLRVMIVNYYRLQQLHFEETIAEMKVTLIEWETAFDQKVRTQIESLRCERCRKIATSSN